MPSQKPVLRIKLLIDVVVAANNTQAVFASLECTKLISAEIRFRIAASRPSMEKILETSGVLSDGVDDGGIFSSRMLMPAENLLITELVAPDIVFGNSKREESTPGGETNDGDDRRRDDGVIIAVDATTVLSKTLSGDNGEEHFGLETFA